MPGIRPHDGVVQGLAGLFVPEDGGFTLVGDADGLDCVGVVALSLELLDCLVDTLLDRGDDLERVMFVPAMPRSQYSWYLAIDTADLPRMRVDLLELQLM